MIVENLKHMRMFALIEVLLWNQANVERKQNSLAHFMVGLSIMKEACWLPKKNQFGDIDKDCYGLKELPAIEKFGFLWVHPCTDG